MPKSSTPRAASTTRLVYSVTAIITSMRTYSSSVFFAMRLLFSVAFAIIVISYYPVNLHFRKSRRLGYGFGVHAEVIRFLATSILPFSTPLSKLPSGRVRSRLTLAQNLSYARNSPSR